jgi:hypothetical protein
MKISSTNEKLKVQFLFQFVEVGQYLRLTDSDFLKYVGSSLYVYVCMCVCVCVCMCVVRSGEAEAGGRA